MSACHCFYDDVNKMSLRAGSTVRESGGVVSGISTVVYHANYDSITLDNDMVVVQPFEPFQVGPNIQIVNVPSKFGYEAPAGLPVTVVGWGMDGDGNRPEQLQKVDLSVGKTSICKDIFADYNPVTESMMCAGVIN
ncbi:trypsin Blo t 3-like [Schistocerca gregaria]|uniref:trypsin Blo t 3-like n=1 Tax=Schistocerca gregaria TaxID=7010 RepID=UPI00211DA911|nr:trypsin Blo t 3-like [Schistocerca gregaria]